MAQKHISEDEIRYVVTAETTKAQKEIFDLHQKTKELSRAEKMRRDQMIELEAQGKKYSKEWQNLKESAEEYHRQIKENNKQEVELTKRLGVTGMTMTQLKKHAKELQRELDNTSKAASPEAYEVLEKRLKVVRGRMEELRDSTRSLSEVLQSEETLNFMAGTFMVKLSEGLGRAVGEMLNFIDEGIEMATTADGITRAFENLNKPDLLDNLRAATKGTVNDVELMKAAVQAKDFRIPLEDMGKYLQFAQLKAQQTGQSVEYMTNSIVTGLGRKSLPILDNLGLSAAEIREKMEETGDMMSAVAAIVEKQLAEAGETYISAADRALQRMTSLQNAQKELGDAMLPLKEDWDEFVGGGKVGMLQILTFLVKHRELTVLLTTSIVGLNVVTALMNQQIKAYITNSKLAAYATATWTTAVNGTKGAGLLCAAAYYKLTGQVKQARAAMIAFNAVGKMNVIGLVTTLVLAGAAALYLLSKRVDNVTEAQKALNKIKGDAAAKLVDEKNKIDLLVAAAKNETLSLDERQRAIRELNKIIPNYNAQLDATTGKYVENKKALDDYLDSLTRQYEIEGAKDMLAELGKKRAELNVQRTEEAKKRDTHQAFAASAATVNTGPGSGGTSFGYWLVDQFDEKKLNDIDRELDKIAAKEAAIRGKYGQEMQKLAVNVTSSTQVGTIGEAIEKVKAEIDALNAERLTIKEGDTKGLEAIDRKLSELQQKKAQLEGSTIKPTTSSTSGKSVDQQSRETDNKAVTSFNTSRSTSVETENSRYQQEINALKQMLVQKALTQEEYNVKEQNVKVAHYATLLDIETKYADQAQQLELNDGEKKEQVVRQQNKNLERAQQQNFDAQLEAQRTFQSIMEKLQQSATDGKKSDPVEQLKAEKEAQLKVLKGYYEASLQYAQRNMADIKQLEADSTVAKTFMENRSTVVDEESEKFQSEIKVLHQQLNEESITLEQYSLKEQDIKTAHYTRLIEIETQFSSQARLLQLNDANMKERLVLQQNKNLEQAQQQSLDAQLETQRIFSRQIRTEEEESVAAFVASRNVCIEEESRIHSEEISRLRQNLEEKSITQEQYDTLERQAMLEHNERLIEIETQFSIQAQQLQLNNLEEKERLVRQQNKNLELAQQQSYDVQLETQRIAQQSEESIKATYISAQENLDIQYAEKKKALELKTQQELLQIRQQYGLVSQQELYDQQMQMLEQQLEEGKLKEEEYEKAKTNLKRDFYKQQFDYYNKLFGDAVSALQDAEIANVNAKYDAEIEAAKGNEEEVERLENEKAQKTLDIQKKYADVNFAIKASQIIADTTVSIMKAYADLGPIAGSIAAALMGVTGAAQLAAANAERQKVKKMTLNNAGGTSDTKTGTRVATGLEKGGSIDVVRKQDGKEFQNADYDPDRRGFVDHPTVIVGEGPVGRSKEFVASNDAVENPTIAPVLAAIDQAQRAGTVRTLDINKVLQLPAFSGRANGGSITPSSAPTPASGGSPAASSFSPEEKELLQKLLSLLQYLIDNGIDAFVILSELEKKQKLLEKSRNIGSK